jgi:manganese/zinc/iron transport system substrate-binding protein
MLLNMRLRWITSFALAIVGLLLTGCGSGCPDHPEGKVRVVATTTMIADLARQIGGEHVEVIGIMRSGEDPHVYEVKPNDATQIRCADLVLMNGVHLEATLGDLVDNKAQGKVVRLAEHEQIELIKGEVTDAAAAADPHCWMNVAYFRYYAEAARDALIEVDPDNADAYRQRTDVYLAELDELDAWVKEQFASVPADQRVIATSHDAFQYFGQAYGIEVHGVIGISTEQQPKPKDIQAMEKMITERGVRGLFTETSAGPTLNTIITQIAERTGATIGGSLFSDSLGEPGSGGETYIKMIRHNTTTMVEAMK